MINETKTDDITTVAELYDYMEKQGFQFKFYDNNPRDEVDMTLKDMQETLRSLVLESTGLQPLLEQMIRKRQESDEIAATTAAINEPGSTLTDLMQMIPDDNDIAAENDTDAINYDFQEQLNNDAAENQQPKIIRKEEDNVD